MALCSLINLQTLHAVRQTFSNIFTCLCQYALQEACAFAQALLLSVCNSLGAQPANCTTHTHQSCSAFWWFQHSGTSNDLFTLQYTSTCSITLSLLQSLKFGSFEQGCALGIP